MWTPFAVCSFWGFLPVPCVIICTLIFPLIVLLLCVLFVRLALKDWGEKRDCLSPLGHSPPKCRTHTSFFFAEIFSTGMLCYYCYVWAYVHHCSPVPYQIAKEESIQISSDTKRIPRLGTSDRNSTIKDRKRIQSIITTTMKRLLNVRVCRLSNESVAFLQY